MRTSAGGDGADAKGLAWPPAVAWHAVVVPLVVATFLIGCSPGGDLPAATAPATEGDHGDTTDAHPWLRDTGRPYARNGLPTHYPYDVDFEGGTVTFDRGPTPGGFPWLVTYRNLDGTVELLELDEAGEVGQRTTGSIPPPAPG